jgi:hypothetical protein
MKKSSNSFLGFDAISLEELNHTASMLIRKDNKYILDSQMLEKFLAYAKNQFSILDIDGVRLFEYETCYFDDEDYGFFADHHSGKKEHMKIRTRRYIDLGYSYLEVKIKDASGVTNKRRLPRTPKVIGYLFNDDLQFISETHKEFFGTRFEKSLGPTINIRYYRTTFVSRNGSERFTVDQNISCFNDQTHIIFPPQNCVVEVKSRDGKGVADELLLSLDQQPVENCSKYCLSLCLTKQIESTSKFHPTLMKLGFDESWL